MALIMLRIMPDIYRTKPLPLKIESKERRKIVEKVKINTMGQLLLSNDILGFFSWGAWVIF